MIICHSRQFIFVKTRKTAGTSVELALSRHMGGDDVVTPVSRPDENLRRELGGRGPQNVDLPWRPGWTWVEWRQLVLERHWPRYFNHMPASGIRKAVGRETWDSYYSFAVERNPWDLAVSAWWWETQARGRSEGFRDFLNSGDLAKYSNWPLYTHRGKILVDTIVRYDQLESQMREISDSVGLPPLELPSAKSSYRRDRRPYQDWYDSSSRERVRSVFSNEIEYFKWTFKQE